MNTNDNITNVRPDRVPHLTRCEICVDGIAYEPDRAVCDACFDEAFESANANADAGVIVPPMRADPSMEEQAFLKSRALYYAAKTRLDEWWARNEEYRWAQVTPDLEHRFESACCRAIWRVLDSSLLLDEMADLILAIDDEQARAEFNSNYTITKATIHNFHVRVGRLLKSSIPDDNVYRLMSPFRSDICRQSPSKYDAHGR